MVRLGINLHRTTLIMRPSAFIFRQTWISCARPRARAGEGLLCRHEDPCAKSYLQWSLNTGDLRPPESTMYMNRDNNLIQYPQHTRTHPSPPLPHAPAAPPVIFAVIFRWRQCQHPGRVHFPSVRRCHLHRDINSEACSCLRGGGVRL